MRLSEVTNLVAGGKVEVVLRWLDSLPKSGVSLRASSHTVQSMLVDSPFHLIFGCCSVELLSNL